MSRNVLRIAALLSLSVGLLLSAAGLAQQSGGNSVHVVPMTGAIGPVTTSLTERAIAQAEDAGAQALIIEMDTPGGLVTSTRDINQAILNANLPVIAYVSPPGARAASAGAFITYASHYAAMAPGTSIGAATPVDMGGGGGEAPSPGSAPEGTDPAVEEAGEAEAEPDATNAPSSGQALRNKVVNDSVAYIRSLAELRGRNADWAEDAVRNGVSVSANEAVALGVVESTADTLDALLQQLEGREIELQSGAVVTLETSDIQIVRIEKSFSEDILTIITDPNIAFMLMNLGFIGLLVSFYNGLEPVTGVAGVICMIVGLYALNTLPVNFAGVALVLLGLGLLVAEAFIVSGGLLALGGLAAFAIGALFLIDTDVDAFQIDWRLIAGATAVLGLTSFLLLSYGLAAQGRKVTTGSQGLIGMKGRVLDWADGEGHVQVDGERWHATSKDDLTPGDTIKVKAVEGLTLVVKKAA
jgi:membrane-bound serine protease (ClpP class)